MKKLIAFIIVVALGWAVWAFFLKSEGETPIWEREPVDENQTQNNSNQNNSSNQNNNNSSNDTDETEDTDTEDSNNDVESPEPEDGVWIGQLETSNDLSKGNLMLELQDSDRVVYINTARDFSSLIGKEVKVSVDGDFNGFTLLGIVENK